MVQLNTQSCLRARAGKYSGLNPDVSLLEKRSGEQEAAARSKQQEVGFSVQEPVRYRERKCFWTSCSLGSGWVRVER